MSADLTEIERLLRDAGLTTAGVAEIMSATPSRFFVAETTDGTGALVAVAGLEVCCDNALLRSVAVDPEWQRHGLGRELVQRIVCHAEERGIRALYLLTMTAEHYFPRFGFEAVDRAAVPADIAETLEFKSACPTTAVAMQRTLHMNAAHRNDHDVADRR
ncbi:MAG TPA: arsenic resistance N-acetyltransferase ArsN2 [Vicinamibacterales bacterium]|nr:arsenic resistance N-acetyltransferase ArsN2 [Vicinamibacterales bacterium]